ncbi:hypothetical protein BHM03_00010882 [Ensete ventricosum]|nr:hypothetical protein BHM03_00010882 [Ensete ventricosum]
MSFYSGCYRSFVPEIFTVFIVYHTVVFLHTVRGPCSEVRVLPATAVACRSYLCQVDCTIADSSIPVSGRLHFGHPSGSLHPVKPPRSAASTLLLLQARRGPSGDRHRHPPLRRCNQEEKRRKRVSFCHARDFLFCSMRGTLLSVDPLHFARCALRGFERDATSNSMLLFPLFLLLIPKSGPSCLHIGFGWIRKPRTCNR